MSDATTARPLRAIVIFLTLIFLGAAVISPWIYRLALGICGADSWLGGHPFHRYYGRTVQVLAVLGLWPFLRALGLRSLANLGLGRPAGQWGRLAGGFALGFASLAVVAWVGVAVGSRMVRSEILGPKLVELLLKSAAGAGVVAMLEEVLFRGALFGGLRRAWPWPFALAVSSAVYALVHFMGKGDGAQAVQWYSGFEMLGQLLGGFTHWREIVPGFFNLALAGAILGLAYQRTGNLYYSIGLHAGWIFWLKICKALTFPASDRTWLWGTWKLVDGWLALPLLLLVLAVVWRWTGGRMKNEESMTKPETRNATPAFPGVAQSGPGGSNSAFETRPLFFILHSPFFIPPFAACREWLEALLGLCYPAVCQICTARRCAREEGFVCERCYEKVRFIRPPFCERCGLPYPGDLTAPFECANCREMELHFRFARSAVAAKSVVLEVIHRYKYQGHLWFEPFLAGLLIRSAVTDLAQEHWDWLVPVPLHPAKEREREFNQAARLAVRLAAASGIPSNLRLLRRVKATRTQTLLSRSERAQNMHDAFVPRAGAKLHGERIVVVDDVFTTGATTSACARALRLAGASEVGVWTLARGL